MRSIRFTPDDEQTNPGAQAPSVGFTPDQQQIERPIDLGENDPANYSPTGQWFPRSAYENPAVKAAYGMLAGSVIPGGGGLLGAAARPAANIGVGTISTLPANSKDLGKDTKDSLLLNSLIEAIPIIGRFGRGLAELVNPLKATEKEISNIKKLHDTSVIAQKAAYKPVFDKYASNMVTEKPAAFLGFDKDTIKYFTPDIKKVYGDFLNEPTFQNLHNLQSKMFTDASKIAHTPGKINTYQTITKARNKAQEKLRSFLGKDEDALSQYNAGAKITKNEVEPFRSSPTLRKIASGNVTAMQPKKLASTIQKAIEKEGMHKTGKGIKTSIPEDHYLRKALENMNSKINRAEIATKTMPEQLQKFLPKATLGQNPLLGGALEKASLPYYGAARTDIGYNLNNQ